MKVSSSFAVSVTLRTAAVPVRDILRTEHRFMKVRPSSAEPEASIGKAPGPNESLTYFWVHGSVTEMAPSEIEPATSYGYTAI